MPTTKNTAKSQLVFLEWLLFNKNTMQVSTTQVTNYAALVGIAIMILNHYGIKVTNEQGDAIASGILALGGVIFNFLHRYSKGDVHLSGVRKS